MNGTVYFIGTAGSGKTALVNAYNQFLHDNSVDSLTVNLDPAVVTLPYNPDIDVRDYVSMKALLNVEPLGPNGAIMAAMDLAATELPKISDAIRDADPEYVLVDTPGQLELFVFRAAGPVIVDSMTAGRKISCFLMDPLLVDEAASLASLLLFSASSSLRLGIEALNVLSKADIAPPGTVERIAGYIEDPESFYTLLTKRSGLVNALAAKIVEAALETTNYAEPIPVSSVESSGLDELHAAVQRAFTGGEVEEPGGARETE